MTVINFYSEEPDTLSDYTNFVTQSLTEAGFVCETLHVGAVPLHGHVLSIVSWISRVRDAIETCEARGVDALFVCPPLASAAFFCVSDEQLAEIAPFVDAAEMGGLHYFITGRSVFTETEAEMDRKLNAVIGDEIVFHASQTPAGLEWVRDDIETIVREFEGERGGRSPC